MSALVLTLGCPAARREAAGRHPVQTAITVLLAGGAALFLASVLVGMVLFCLDRVGPASFAILGALACAGAAGFHLGLAVACVRELRRA
jgi:hypothetical protein